MRILRLAGAARRWRCTALALYRLGSCQLLNRRDLYSLNSGLSGGYSDWLATFVFGVFGQYALRIKQIAALNQVGFIRRGNQAAFLVHLINGSLSR
jgi:hypothetical protein